MTVATSKRIIRRKPFDIAVVGGGIAGITLAIGLLRQNITVALYEGANAFGEIGAGVAFGPNATRAMMLIDPAIKHGFDARATYNQWESKAHYWFDFREGIHRGRVGNHIHSLLCPHGQASVHRAHFLDEIVKLVPEGVSKFAKRLQNLEQLDDGDVVLKFADGTTAKHNAVIGCDGIKSTTRTWLLGKDNPASRAVFTGKYAYRGLVPMDKAVKLLGEELALNSQMYLGHHGHVVTFPIEQGKTMNVVAFSSREKWESEQWVIRTTKEELYADFEDWGESVRSILSLLQQPDIWALFDHPPTNTYYRNRVCLLGDAAHASTPHQGAGAGMAVEDAYVMSNLLANVCEPKGIEKAFEAFDTVRRPRTQKLVSTSREAGQLYDFELEGVGDNVDRIRENLHQRMHWIWKEDLKRELEDARNIMASQETL